MMNMVDANDTFPCVYIIGGVRIIDVNAIFIRTVLDGVKIIDGA